MCSDRLEVVSEVNTFLTPASSVKPITSDKYRVAKLAFSVPVGIGHQKKAAGIGSPDKDVSKVKLDSDGDLVLPRKIDIGLEELSLLIEYDNSTVLEKVGLQVWRGAFLLADFLIHHRKDFAEDKCVLELGSGTGLTAIVASMFAKHVTATDIHDAAILKLLEINAKTHNKILLNCDFDVKPLDFLQMDWPEEVTEKVSQADVILAADVVYHVNITNAFVKTLRKLATTGHKSKDILIAMEKRYVFTVADLDTGAPMYDHFMDELEQLLGVYPGCLEKPIQGDNGATFHMSLQFLPLDFPQYFAYERNKHLILLHLKSIVK